MRSVFNNIANHLTDWETSPVLNATKLAGHAAHSKASKSLIAGVLVLGAALAMVPSAQASKNWEARDGVHGEIKYVRFCNKSPYSQLKLIVEAHSQGSHVKWVELKMKSHIQWGFHFGRLYPIYRPYDWYHVAKRYNSPPYLGDKRFYSFDYPWLNMITTDPNAPTKFAVHVYHGNGYTTKHLIDLGGIVNLGNIPVGQCRTYDDGVFRNY